MEYLVYFAIVSIVSFFFTYGVCSFIEDLGV